MTAMSEPNNFFPQRFKDAARHYTTGRPAYPKLLARRVAELIGLDADGRVLDIGTGPGFLAIDFAPWASEVIALDPSPEMLAAAQANAAEAEVEIRFVQGSSYDLGEGFGRFKLATFGRSFHWTDRAGTLAALDRLIVAGGAVALFGDRFPDLPQNAWRAAFKALLDRCGEEDPARRELRSPVNHETVLLASAFDHLERVSVLERRRTPLQHFVDRALSFGKTWHGRPGFKPEALAEETRHALRPWVQDDGAIEEIVEGHALVARRPAEVTGAARSSF